MTGKSSETVFGSAVTDASPKTPSNCARTRVNTSSSLSSSSPWAKKEIMGWSSEPDASTSAWTTRLMAEYTFALTRSE